MSKCLYTRVVTITRTEQAIIDIDVDDCPPNSKEALDIATEFQPWHVVKEVATPKYEAAITLPNFIFEGQQ